MSAAARCDRRTRIDGSLNSGTAALALTRIRACASARSRWPERAAARPDFRCRLPQIATDTVDIRRHLEAVRQELRAPLGVLDLAEGHAEAAGDAQLADAVATLTHRFVETLDAYERAVEALDALEATAR